jgi:hypothetical protein
MLATYDNVFASIGKTKGVTLKTSATVYKKGTVVVLNVSGTYENSAITGSLTQVVGVVVDDEVDATLADKAATIAIECEVNTSELIFGGGQIYANVAGILQQLGIKATTWRQ